ncbi:AAA family ATPase [Streptomyces shenzhenensis]|uniref:AAA family ATPase n=1 Tax=Streptomyces shenzhenensis TaxID=943815 RepID=UPI001F180A7F|nr:AAA family ATPase [Streptomyces shenzhenensis]
MRIMSFEVDSFKNLKDFSISLDPESPVSVLVGRNGAGKSNFLEALTIVFRDLDLGWLPTFSYRLEYEVGGHDVTVRSESTSGRDEYKLECTVDGKPVSPAKFVGAAGAAYRPTHVFGYYSGPSNRLEEHFVAHQERFYKDLLAGIDRPLRPLFYARNVHSNFVLLSFFLDEDPTVRQLLRDQLGIEELDSVLFEMQKPSWGNKGRGGDPRFWRARGTVRALLDRLYALSLAPTRLNRKVRTGLGGRLSESEHLFLYLESLEKSRELASAYPSNSDFFKALESTYISELIYDVRIRVRTSRSDTPLTFRELSEGEQQLLLVLGLMRFTREEESLFLLDEPDTHLNPAWSVRYRQFLSEVGALDEGCHVLMATHDPLVVAGLLKNEVRILEREADGRISAVEPLEHPRGMGVGSLLTSDIYGLRSQLDLETLTRLDRKRDLASRVGVLSESEADELNQLGHELSDLGLLMENRDPEFQEYLRAKADVREPENSIVLTRQEIEENREAAAALLKELDLED